MINSSYFSEPTPTLARTNPEVYKISIVKALAREAIFGAAVWDKGVQNHTIEPTRFNVDPTTWISSSNSGSGRINLGVAPMDMAMRDQVVFDPEQFNYSQEVSYRLLHEAMHGIVYMGSGSKSVTTLHETTQAVRDQAQGYGMTALGSLAFYGKEYKAREDTTELMTMYAWSPEYLAKYINFLEATNMASERAQVGIADVENANVLYDMVENAVITNL